MVYLASDHIPCLSDENTPDNMVLQLKIPSKYLYSLKTLNQDFNEGFSNCCYIKFTEHKFPTLGVKGFDSTVQAQFYQHSSKISCQYLKREDESDLAR